MHSDQKAARMQTKSMVINVSNMYDNVIKCILLHRLPVGAYMCMNVLMMEECKIMHTNVLRM